MPGPGIRRLMSKYVLFSMCCVFLTDTILGSELLHELVRPSLTHSVKIVTVFFKINLNNLGSQRILYHIQVIFYIFSHNLDQKSASFLYILENTVSVQVFRYVLYEDFLSRGQKRGAVMHLRVKRTR